jgi:hypothetical protein
VSTSGGEAPQVAWIAIDEDATVVAADGSEIGSVVEVTGDEEADIFDGLVVKHARGDGHRYVPAERVKAMWPDRVETDLTAAEASSLPPYVEPQTTVWHAGEGGGFLARLRRAGRDLFGR